MLVELHPKTLKPEQCLHNLCHGTRKATNPGRFALTLQPPSTFTFIAQTSFVRRTNERNRIAGGGSWGREQLLELKGRHPWAGTCPAS